MSRHFEDSTPIYLQIAEEVRTQILSGDLSDGDRLTSTTEYATRYRINPGTAPTSICETNGRARTWTPLSARPCTQGESWD